MGNCFSCHKKLGITNNWRNAKTIQEYGYKPPEGMSKHDKLCASCLDVIVNKTRIENGVCKECGHKLDPNLTYCSNCKSNAKTEKPIPHKPQKSARHIKFSYYFDIFTFIWSPIAIISGLIDEDPIRWMPAIIILVVVLIQFPKDKKLFNGLSKNEDSILPKTEDTPLTALKMRLAKGEITKEEFYKIKEDLK